MPELPFVFLPDVKLGTDKLDPTVDNGRPGLIVLNFSPNPTEIQWLELDEN